MKDTRAKIGEGIYTIPDMAKVFGIQTYKVRRWVKDYWDERLTIDFDQKFSWTDGKSRAVSFHTLIELFVYIQLTQTGVGTREILKAHQELSKLYNTQYPFATKNILMSLCSDGKKVVFDTSHGIFHLDGKRQFKLSFFREFLKKLEFGDDELVSKFYPLGKDSAIVLDPKRHFGQPVIQGTNIVAHTIYRMYSAGDNQKFLSSLYGISEKEVSDAIAYCKEAA